MAPTPVLEARDLTKRYGNGATIFERLNLRLGAGEAALIQGRSGSGKSTLFKLLAGLDTPTAGDILVDGTSLRNLDDAALSDVRLHKIGLVFQSFNLLPQLTVRENVRLPLEIAKTSNRDERVNELLDLLGITHLAHRKPHEISGGESQRTAIARALANKPAIILADEPTANLDRKNAENVLQAFDDVNRRLGTAILMISHDALAVEHYARRFKLEEGRLESLTPEAASRAP